MPKRPALQAKTGIGEVNVNSLRSMLRHVKHYKLPLILTMTSMLALVAILVLALPGLAQEEAVPAVDEAPDFNGQWVLNKQQSQDFAAIMRQEMGGMRGGKSGGMSGGGGRGGGGGGGRGGGGGGGGGRGGGGMGGQQPGGSDENMAKMRERALRMQQEYSRLEIFNDGPELNLTNGLNISQLHFTDGRETSIWTERGEMKARTRWEGNSLRIQTTGTSERQKAPGRTRTFSLSEDGSQLILIEERTLPKKKDPITIRMVYDRER